MTKPIPKWQFKSRNKRVISELTLEFFLNRTDRTGECWLWTRGKAGNGYGITTVAGRQMYAHRLIYEVINGPIPPGIEICHNCPSGDNPSCINPAHLFAGTRKENAQDMGRKGRGVFQVHPEKAPLGERNGNVKLTKDQVIEIRLLKEKGLATITQIAMNFGVTDSAICKVIFRRTWRHI